MVWKNHRPSFPRGQPLRIAALLITLATRGATGFSLSCQSTLGMATHIAVGVLPEYSRQAAARTVVEQMQQPSNFQTDRPVRIAGQDVQQLSDRRFIAAAAREDRVLDRLHQASPIIDRQPVRLGAKRIAGAKQVVLQRRMDSSVLNARHSVL